MRSSVIFHEYLFPFLVDHLDNNHIIYSYRLRGEKQTNISGVVSLRAGSQVIRFVQASNSIDFYMTGSFPRVISSSLNNNGLFLIEWENGSTVLHALLNHFLVISYSYCSEPQVSRGHWKVEGF
jgi:hypothetical protein